MQYYVKNKIPKIIMPLCDETLYTLKMSSYLFDKYWPSHTKIDVIGFKKPDFCISEKMNFISIAERQKGGSHGWSKYILEHIQGIEDERIIMTLEDFFPIKSPDLDMITKIVKLMESNDKIGRFDVTYDSYAEGDHTLIRDIGEISIIKKQRYSQYRISTQPAIWNKNFLIKILQQTTSPWDFEINGSKISNGLDYEVLAIGDKTFKNYPTYWIHKGAVSRNYPNKINVLGLDTDTIKEMVALNYFKEEDLVWGMFNNIKSPSFHDLGGYSFDPRKMPTHEASKTNWKEYYHIYIPEVKQ